MLCLEPVTLISEWRYGGYNTVLVVPLGDHSHFLDKLYVIAATQL
jgi:hypothetical protein